MRLISFLLALLMPAMALGASHRTANFLITAPSAELAYQVAEAAEAWRTRHYDEWFGVVDPGDWAEPCDVRVSLTEERFDGGGSTSIFFEPEVTFSGHWYGPPQKLIDDVVPHEVLHTVFAAGFKKPIPRWCDEGCCTACETKSSQDFQLKLCIEQLKSRRGIPPDTLVTMREYPKDMRGSLDMRGVQALYAQGWVVSRYLIDHGGKQKFADAIRDADPWTVSAWEESFRSHYGFGNLVDLQNAWLDWVKRGLPHDGRWQHVAWMPGRCVGGQCQPGAWRQFVPSVMQPRAMTVVQPTRQPTPSPTQPIRTQELAAAEARISRLEGMISDLTLAMSKAPRCECDLSGVCKCGPDGCKCVGEQGPPGPQGPVGPQGPAGVVDMAALHTEIQRLVAESVSGRTQSSGVPAYFEVVPRK